MELHLGRSWRDNDDTDVSIVRRDAVDLPSVLDGWEIHMAAAGRLTPWTGDEIAASLHQNNLWCRRHAGGPWVLDITIGEGDDDTWIYRRDPRVRIPWADAVLHPTHGVPYLVLRLRLS